MSTTAVPERIAMRSREPWPRLADWIDTFIPADFVRRSGIAHNIRIEESSHDGKFVIRAELPGLDPDKDVSISLQGRLLTIEATREERAESEERSEFYYGQFVRVIPLPDGADPDTAEASYEDGILEIRMTMKEETGSTQRIPITTRH